MRRPVPARNQQVNIPAPVGGLNTISAGSAMPPEDCVQLYNMVAAEYGLRSRLGSREWCTGLTGATDDEVRTVLPFTGSTKNGSKNRLFATTSTGIWDVSASTDAPVQVLAFPIQVGEAGRGISHGMTTGGGHFLLYCDEENGYHVYSETTDTWVAVAMGGGGSEVSGVDPANFCFVTVWKSRAWFVEKDSAKAWYLDAGSIFGTATMLNLDRAAQFRAGGGLVGLWNWTLDGGVGIDDFLVAVSGGGDVAIYQGSDPAEATTFALKGTWQAGALPAGRRVATNFGGDVLLMTKSGIRPLSQLVVGGDGAGTYATQKIANLFNSLMLTRSELPNWAMHIHPEDNSIIVTVPTDTGQATEQLAQMLWNRSWSRYRDLPIFSAGVWGKKLHFGTADGRVCINDGYVDGITLADPNSYTVVQWAALTAFQNLGNARQKRVQMIRPTVLSDGVAPTFQAEARYRYDFREIDSVTETATVSGNAWDAAVWDTDVFGGDYQATQVVRGAVGMGVDVAIAIRGIAKARTVLVGIDVAFDQGGFL